MPKETKLYDILGVTPADNAQTIKKAYFKLAQKYNPNIPENKEKFQEISNAYEILKDEEKRRLYDQYGLEGMKNPMMGDPMDPFGMFFGRGNRQQRGPKQAEPIGKEVVVTLQQMFNGDDIKVSVNRTAKCPTCNGEGSSEPGNITTCDRCNGNGVVIITTRQGNTIFQQQGTCPLCNGKGEKIKDQSKICKSCRGNRLVSETKTINVHIEPGTPDKHQQIVHSEGNWVPGKLQGDLVIIVKQKKDDIFRREEADLFMDKQISLEEALCGTSFDLKHPSGETVTIFREPGKPINHGDILSVKSLGMPIYGRIYEHGNLFIQFSVKFPKELTNEIRTKITELLGTPATKKNIANCDTLKDNGVSICKLQYIDPRQRTKNDVSSKGQDEYGDNEDMQGQGQQVQCGGM